MKYLIVIDMQKDFVDGVLGTAEARAISPSVIKRAEEFEGTVIFTRDTHTKDYLKTQEGKNLPVEHCIEGSDGWQLINGLEEIRKNKNCTVFNKGTFGSIEMAETLKKEYDKGNIDEIEIIGVCTDICVVSNALLLKAYMPELPISINKELCAGVTPDKHKAALETMSSCQIKIF